MSVAAKSLIALSLALALAACGGPSQDTEANNAAATDIEALPPDESVDTLTEGLANGADEPDSNEVRNSY